MENRGRPFKANPKVDLLFMDIEFGNNQKVIQVIREEGIETTDRYKRTLLINASFYKNIQLVNWCLENRANINAQDKMGMTALHFAAQEGHTEVAKILIHNNAEINITDKHGRTPLLTVVSNWDGGKNFETIQYLYLNGADPSIKNNYGICANDIITNELRNKLEAIE